MRSRRGTRARPRSGQPRRRDDLDAAGAAGGLLAKGGAGGREGRARFLLAAGIVLAPQLSATSTLLQAPDHTGTAVALLAVWLVIDGPVRTGWSRWRSASCWPGSWWPTRSCC